MKKAILFVVTLATGIAASAWFGMADAGIGAARVGQSKLHTNARLPGDASRNDGEAAQLYKQSLSQRTIYQTTRRLLPIASPLPHPGSGDWRSQVREPEQDFGQYVNSSRRARGMIVVQPIGDLPPDQTRALSHLLDAIAHFYGMPAGVAAPIPLAALPRESFRQSGSHLQINAEYLMEHVLRPHVGNDIASILALTDLDIYPGEQWPFESAYGWSSFNKGTAVLSSNQILTATAADRGRNLLRLSKLGIHELCHTFTLKHCAKYACLMNGCSDIEENDAKPFMLCPDCLAKISLATGREPQWHLESMLELCRRKGFFEDGGAYYRALTIMKQ